MSVHRGVLVGVLACGVVLATVAGSEARQADATHVMVPADKVAFQAIEVPGFQSGMKIAAISGDPNAESGTYVIRMQFPDGYRFPPHWHPMAENVTVLSGTLVMGMGEKADSSKLAAYSPGAFMSIPGKMAHFGGATGVTVIQLHGQAPFKIELVTPK